MSLLDDIKAQIDNDTPGRIQCQVPVPVMSGLTIYEWVAFIPLEFVDDPAILDADPCWDRGEYEGREGWLMNELGAFRWNAIWHDEYLELPENWEPEEWRGCWGTP